MASARPFNSEEPVQRLHISGAALASLIHDVAAGQGDGDGLLFGHMTCRTATSLHDHSDAPAIQEEVIATITGYCFTGQLLSFYDATGTIDQRRLMQIAGKGPDWGHSDPILGWFVSQQQVPLRPSMRQIAVTSSLRSYLSATWPCFLALFSASTSANQAAHNYEYKFLQCHRQTSNLQFIPRSLSIVNIGPYFRGHYDSFAPTAKFPYLGGIALESPRLTRVASARRVFPGEEGAREALERQTEGYGVESLRALMGGEGVARHAAELENLYGSMLVKLENMAKEVCEATMAVAEQARLNEDFRQVRRASGQS